MFNLEVISKHDENLLREGTCDSSTAYQHHGVVLLYAEHRRLRFKPSQIELFEHDNERDLRYTEDVSKSNEGGLAHRKKEPKQVIHYENVDNSVRCLIRSCACPNVQKIALMMHSI